MKVAFFIFSLLLLSIQSVVFQKLVGPWLAKMKRRLKLPNRGEFAFYVHSWTEKSSVFLSETIHLFTFQKKDNSILQKEGEKWSNTIVYTHFAPPDFV